MRSNTKVQLALATFVGVGAAFDLPDNLRAIYDEHKSKTCDQKLASGFSATYGGAASFSYCADIPNAVYISGDAGQLADMDIDCDGANNQAGDCANDPTGQSQTAFKYEVGQYNVGITDLDSNAHPFVVLGNTGAPPSFDMKTAGIEPLSVVAVVCNNQLHYGVWGDINGETVVGEASISLAKLCFPDEGLNGNKGHTETDVLYLAFPGEEAVPGASGAAWTANNAEAFEQSIKSLGDSFVAKL